MERGEGPRRTMKHVVIESRSDSVANPEVEVVLTADVDYERDMSYSDDDDDDMAYHQQQYGDAGSFSPIPLGHESDVSYITDDLLQLPIAPCGPHDGDS
jgi:hypothetical protein